MKAWPLLRLFQLTLAATILFDLGSASSVCCQSITNNPSEAEQYRKLMHAIAQRNYSETMAQGRKLIERTNKYGQVYSRIVRAAKSAGRLEDGKALFKSLLQMSPPNPRGDYGLGLIYSEQKDFATAIEHYKKCLDKQPEFPLPMLALVDAYRRVEKLDEAEAYIKSLIHVRPDSPVAHLGLGYCYVKSYQTDAAVMEFDLAQSLNPKLPDACYQKARFLFFIGRRKESFDTTARCLPAVESEMDEDHWQAFLNVMAANQANLGEYSEAVNLLNQALGLARKVEDKG